MASSLRDLAEYFFGDRLPIYSGSSDRLAVLYPFSAGTAMIDPKKRGRKIPGIPIGYCGEQRSGGVFGFDEYALFQAEVIRNSNVMVFGEVGQGKSGFVKSLIYRGAALGYNHIVTDIKGEYTRLARAIAGSKVVQLGKKANIFLNPLDEVMDAKTQNALVAAMILTAMGTGRRELSVIEKSLLWHTIDRAHKQAGDHGATLDDVNNSLFMPDETIAMAMHRTKTEVRDQGYELALATQRLTQTDLSGMFSQRTTPGLFRETPLLVFNCEGIEGDEAAIMITLINFFTQSRVGGENPAYRFHKIIHDEVWRLIAYPGFVESLRSSLKLGGTRGVSNIVVTHHKSNLDNPGYAQAIQDIVTDTATFAVFRQNEEEIQRSAKSIGFNDADTQGVLNLAPGHFLMKIDNHPGILVEHVRWPEERKLLETRDLLKGQDLPAEEGILV